MRTATLVAACLAALALGTGSALACTTPNWITVEPAAAAPGQPVTVNGGGYEAGPVDLRWGGLDGAALAAVQADADGRISAEIALPDVAPGRSQVVGVQGAADGTRLWGFADVDVEAAPVGLLRGGAAWAGAGLALLAAAALGLWVRGRRTRRHPDPGADGDAERPLFEAEVTGSIDEDDETPTPVA